MRENINSVVSLIGAVFFLATIPIHAHALTPGQVFDKVKDSVIVVKTLDAQGKVKSQGSGVLLPSGKIATNCHVVEGGASYHVGRGKDLVRATLYAEDGDKDICFLDAKGITGKPGQLGKTAGLKVGDTVYAVGAPQGLELSLSDGIVAQLRGGPPPLIQTTAAISPGSSGGGLFDGEGRLVGLTTLYIEGGQSLNFAMPVEWIGDIKPGRKTVAKSQSQSEWLKRAIALQELKDWEGMLELCQKWTGNEPTNANAWFYLGVAYDGLAFNERYNKTDRPSIQGKSENLSQIAERFMDALDENARSSARRKAHLDAAIDAYRQIIQIDPKHAKAWNNLAAAYVELTRYNDAIDAYRQAVHIDPQNANVWSNLGLAYNLNNLFNEAIDPCRQAVRIDPQNVNAWTNLVGAYFRSGNRTAALEAVQKLRRIDPKRADELFNVIVPR